VKHALLKALDDEVVSGRPAGGLGRKQLGKRQPVGGEVGRVLDLGDHRDRTPRCIQNPHQVAQAQDAGRTAEGRAPLPQRGESFGHAEGREVLPQEVLGEPPVVASAVDELPGAQMREFGAGSDIRCSGDLVLVPQHEHPVSRGDDVGFDRVCAERDGELVCLARVLRTVSACAPVGDHEGAMRHGSNATANTILGMAFCTTCGVELTPSWKFCIRCGSALRPELVSVDAPPAASTGSVATGAVPSVGTATDPAAAVATATIPSVFDDLDDLDGADDLDDAEPAGPAAPAGGTPTGRALALAAGIACFLIGVALLVSWAYLAHVL